VLLFTVIRNTHYSSCRFFSFPFFTFHTNFLRFNQAEKEKKKLNTRTAYSQQQTWNNEFSILTTVQYAKS
jgi:hypothetical protein